MKSTVQLKTTGLTSPVFVTSFQFGTVPAPDGSYQLIRDSVPAGVTAIEIFWLERNVRIPEGETIRFNLRFQVDIHNSANLQVQLTPSGSGTIMEWRWSAPIGFVGAWSAAKQQASWYDSSMDYCINISGTDMGILVVLTAHPGSINEQCPFIPKESFKKEMSRNRFGK